MSSRKCQIDDMDSFAVYDDDDGVCFDIVESGHTNTVSLSYRDAMQVAGEIVRIAHGERTPRVWETAKEIPDGVIVEFEDGVADTSWAVRYGDAWIYRDGPDGEWEPWEHASHSPTHYSPFMEVI